MKEPQDKSERQKAAPKWLTGQFLIAMPAMRDPRFEKTVLLICSHGPEGAMGIVINRLFGELNFSGLLGQFDVDLPEDEPDRPVYYGGPVDPVRGFVLHSSDYKREGTNDVSSTVSLTSTIEILRDIAEGKGPDRSLMALGYAGWISGQLEAEIQANGWLTAPLDEDILFDTAIETKWERALSGIGVSPSLLVGDVGHA
ncbi:MAG TPA: YqgE/AlgH family protein [Rhodospirillaceae bacterium]|nr:YqgE/AlgH family protein [Rhodospirillaceae bacterium]